MEKLIDFFGEHWVILIIVNFLAIVFIIGYLYEKRSENKKNRKNNYNDMIIFDDQTTPLKNNNINTIEKDIIEDKKENKENNTNINNVNIENKNDIKNNEEQKVQNIYSIDKETKKQIHDNIEYIINQNNSVFEEFDNVVPKKSIIEDKLKKEFEIIDEDNTSKFEKHKKNIDIDTNIELPEINISIEDEDIWS